MENVLDNMGLESENINNIQNKTSWTGAEYKNQYDMGSLMAGLTNSENSVSDMMTKFSTLLSSLAKARNKQFDQKILDLVKLSLSMYVSNMAFDKKNFDSDNMKSIAAIHGFISQYVENCKRGS